MKKLHFNKYILFLVLFKALPVFVFPQSIGIGTAIPNASSALDITNNAKGLLIPRMTTTAVTAIISPAKGLLVYDTVQNQLMVNMGTATSPNWQTIVAHSGWGLTGNGGINPSTQFIGTTDAQPLVFKANNLKSGLIDISGVANTSFGHQALANNSSGFYNTAIGSHSLYINTTGERNTSIGPYTMAGNTTGSYNTAIGLYALGTNNGSFNTATGVNSLEGNVTGDNNTAYGVNTLFSNLTGFANTANGYDALYSNTTGDYNIANGYEALYSNILGGNNIANGNQALYSNTTGYDNIANGYQALYSNINGHENIANGYQALYSNTSGYQNTATGSFALYNNTTGSNNIAIGTSAGKNIADPFYNHNNCIFIGNGASAIGSLSGFENAIAIGMGAIVDESNSVIIGNFSIHSIGGAVDWTTLSDGRFKKDIKENVSGLAFIMKLRPVTYHLNITGLNNKLYNGRKIASGQFTDAATREKEQTLQTGFVAQEVEQAANNAGYDFSGVDKPKTDDGLYGLRYAAFVVPLVKAVQEQQAIIQKQQAMLNDMKKRIEVLEAGNKLLQPLPGKQK
jgi:trimeric autotransporter adhesin